MRNTYWLLALLSLSLGLAATTPTKPVATKGKAPAPATKAAAKTTAKAAPAKPASAAANKAPVRTNASTARPQTPAAAATRGRVQPQYSRYQTASRYNSAAAARNRRPVTTGRNSYARPKPAYHPAQAQPTPDRYKEIQSALVQKGYLKSEPSGSWDAESTEAMKRFQKDQNLDADGKLNSLSIIALGLGPKRTLSASAVNPPAAGLTATPTTPAIPVPPKP